MDAEIKVLCLLNFDSLLKCCWCWCEWEVGGLQYSQCWYHTFHASLGWASAWPPFNFPNEDNYPALPPIFPPQVFVMLPILLLAFPLSCSSNTSISSQMSPGMFAIFFSLMPMSLPDFALGLLGMILSVWVLRWLSSLEKKICQGIRYPLWCYRKFTGHFCLCILHGEKVHRENRWEGCW